MLYTGTYENICLALHFIIKAIELKILNELAYYSYENCCERNNQSKILIGNCFLSPISVL